jgi:hypothetical protein
VEVPRHQQVPPGVDASEDAELPGADDLAVVDAAQLQPLGPDGARPWLPAGDAPF